MGGRRGGNVGFTRDFRNQYALLARETESKIPLGILSINGTVILMWIFNKL
jgi:hypothetical protein